MRQYGKKQGLSGQITVFISMILMILFAFLCVLMESARTAGARWYLQMAASSAMDSVFSQYHRELWDRYRLLFAEYESPEEIEQDFAGFLLPYLETKNWYPMALEQTVAEEIVRATDGHGAYLEKEILDYMKYGVWKLDFEGDAVPELWDYEREAEAVTEMAQSYRLRTRDVWKLERVLEDISGNLDRQRTFREQGLNSLSSYDGAGFRREAERMIGELRKIPGLVRQYEKEADKLATVLASDRQEQNARADRFSAGTAAALEEEIQEYEAYIAEDGKRRQEIRDLDLSSAEQIQRLEALIELSYEVEREIEEWEDDDDEDGDGGEPDYESLWRPVRNGLEGIVIPVLSFAHGIQDKEKEGWLKQVEQLYQEGMLGLLVPDGHQISEKLASTAELPSHTESYEEGAGSGSMVDHVLVNEYCGMFFSQFCSGAEQKNISEKREKRKGLSKTGTDPGETTGDGTKPEIQLETQAQVLDYEIEYLLFGNASDRENLSDAVHRLLAVRSGLNLIHILSDSGKREQARALAAVITGAGSITPLILVTTFFVMSVWALGEALMDVKGLLAGKKVVLLKTSEDWTLDVENLLVLGRDGTLEAGGGERGLSYLSWLKILLFVEPAVRQEYRIMDVIQLNLGQGKSGFRMRNGVYQVHMSGNVCGKYLFFSPAFVENMTGNRETGMNLTVKVERRY
ncbi:DUF5702 domain-containing protein [Clostridium sp. AM42-4]|uniref:DUF5702 domain-containing protein n=1 Tax=Clostridium sp. AM42-4 TaxID=2292305 RepID=UPI000E4F948B|nr:DUF5702 domain-containing protein [Clostridium sp. AM42-4]RHS90602.1 hypothetical protein DW922_02370 [Clostridium sp. AM42-4]